MRQIPHKTIIVLFISLALPLQLLWSHLLPIPHSLSSHRTSLISHSYVLHSVTRRCYRPRKLLQSLSGVLCPHSETVRMHNFLSCPIRTVNKYKYMDYAVDEKKLGNTCIYGQTIILAFMKKLCKIKLQQDVVVVVFGIQLVTPQPVPCWQVRSTC